MGAGIKMGWDGGRGGTWWGRRGGGAECGQVGMGGCGGGGGRREGERVGAERGKELKKKKWTCTTSFQIQ